MGQREPSRQYARFLNTHLLADDGVVKVLGQLRNDHSLARSRRWRGNMEQEQGYERKERKRER